MATDSPEAGGSSRVRNRVVLLAGFDPLVARTFYNALNESPLLQVLEANVRASDAVRALDAYQPAAALVCWEGFDAAGLKRMTSAYPSVGVIVLARALTDAQGRALLRCGAVGALERPVARNLLIAAAVLAGYGMRLEARPPGARQGSGTPGAPSLSLREAEVLGLLEYGETPAAIAELFAVSANTVKSQVKAIYRKLGVRNGAELRRRQERIRGDSTHGEEPTGGARVMRLDLLRQERRRARPGWVRPPFPRAGR
jgi:DNA-binding NarL/FixJ family response regulator